MKSNYSRNLSRLLLTQESERRALKDMIVFYDMARKVNNKWFDMTGNHLYINYETTYVMLWLDMEKRDHLGRLPTRMHEIAYIVEYIDELMDGVVPFDQFNINVDKTSTDFLWGPTYDSRFRLYAKHSSICTFKQVDVETYTRPIYEMQCV